MEKNNKVSDKLMKEELTEFEIPYRDKLTIPEDVRYGIEIEFKIDDYNEDYILKNENDLVAARKLMLEKGYDYSYKINFESSNQIELISSVLKDDRNSWIELKNILRFIRDNKGYCTDDSGAHIHICKNIFNENPNNWLIFFKLWYIFEDYIFVFTNGKQDFTRKSADTYARKVCNICKTILNDYDLLNIIDIPYLIHNKGNCINFNSNLFDNKGCYRKVLDNNKFDKSNTIEFRCPNGTLEDVTWQNNINFFINLLLSCNDSNFDIEKVNYLYKNKESATEFDLINLIYKDELDKKCFLKQYYK